MNRHDWIIILMVIVFAVVVFGFAGWAERS